MEEGNKVWEVTRSHSNVGFKPKSISCRGPLHLMTSSGYSHSGFVWVFSLGKGQIIHSWKHSFLLTDFSRFFERQADLLGTLLLDKPAPLVLSSAQQTPSYEQRLSISGYPWTMLYSGSVLDWSPILTACSLWPWHRSTNIPFELMSFTQSYHKHASLFTFSTEWNGK